MMSQIQTIQLNNVSYQYPGSDQAIFSGIDLALAEKKYAIVGDNGCGKSTLLKLMIQQLSPTQGNISCSGSMSYLGQNDSLGQEKIIADVLQISEKRRALQRITAGSTDENDYNILDDDWTVEQQAQLDLTDFGLAQHALDKPVRQLSGGEQTRLGLLQVFRQHADFVLLDEPSNHCDSMIRKMLMDRIIDYPGCVIIASHDRGLLRCVDTIIELSTLGIKIYGGNFDDYQEQKHLEKTATQQRLQAEQQIVKKAEQTIKERLEKHQKACVKGIRQRKQQLKARGSVNKIEMNSAKGRSERTNKRIRLQAAQKTKKLQQTLATAKKNIEVKKSLILELPQTSIPSSKVVLRCDDVCFAYAHQSPVINHFNLELVGPERIALIGENGSGKTTLINLILEKLKPQSGNIEILIEHVRFIDQHAALLKPSLSIYENFKHFNPSMPETECRHRLAQCLFRNTAADKKVVNLSGGEKLRALLACVLLSTQPPKLLILDEPTNHLDLQSITVIEDVLQQYRGALMVVSHDDDFLQNIGVTQFIEAPF